MCDDALSGRKAEMPMSRAQQQVSTGQLYGGGRLRKKEQSSVKQTTGVATSVHSCVIRATKKHSFNKAKRGWAVVVLLRIVGQVSRCSAGLSTPTILFCASPSSLGLLPSVSTETTKHFIIIYYGRVQQVRGQQW